jgi:hypothetical protein
MNDRRDAAKNIAGAMFAPTTLERDNPQSVPARRDNPQLSSAGLAEEAYG